MAAAPPAHPGYSQSAVPGTGEFYGERGRVCLHPALRKLRALEIRDTEEEEPGDLGSAVLTADQKGTRPVRPLAHTPAIRSHLLLAYRRDFSS